MSTDVQIDAQGQHQFVVRLTAGSDVAEAWVTLSSDALAELGVAEDGEEELVRRTIAYLLEHQEVADFPAIVDIEDVVATYDGYLDAMRAPAGR